MSQRPHSRAGAGVGVASSVGAVTAAPLAAAPAQRPATTMHARTSEEASTQQLRDLARQLIDTTPPRSEDDASDSSREADGSSLSDETSVAVSLAFRLAQMLMRSHTPDEMSTRVDAIYSRELTHHILRFVSGGHELSFLFVRLLGLLARAPDCGRAMLEAGSDHADGGAESTFIQVISGLLRLSGAPLMTTELVHLVAELTGATLHDEETYGEVQAHTRVTQIQRAHRLNLKDQPAPLTPREEVAYSRFVRRAESRALFVRSFLGPRGRSVLLLTKHLPDGALHEDVRTTLLRVLYVLASHSPPGAVGVARRVLNTATDKWSEHSLPPINHDAQSNTSTDMTDKERQISRRQQLRLIADIRAVLLLASDSAAAAPPSPPSSHSLGSAAAHGRPKPPVSNRPLPPHSSNAVATSPRPSSAMRAASSHFSGAPRSTPSWPPSQQPPETAGSRHHLTHDFGVHSVDPPSYGFVGANNDQQRYR